MAQSRESQNGLSLAVMTMSEAEMCYPYASMDRISHSFRPAKGRSKSGCFLSGESGCAQVYFCCSQLSTVDFSIYRSGDTL